MVAWAGIEMLNMGISNSIEGQEVKPRWNIGNLLLDRPGSAKSKFSRNEIRSSSF